ncbi:MAG: hypothetical protein AB7Q97_17610 [Gammaproteobacteria bacterium]
MLLGQPAAAFTLYATTSPDVPTGAPTLIAVTPESGAHTVVGASGLAGNVHAMDFNPADGLLYGTDQFSAPGTILRIDPATGTGTAIVTVRNAAAAPVFLGGLAFAPDGTAIGATTTSIGTLDLHSGTFQPMIQVKAGHLFTSIDIAADGRLLAVLSPFSGGQRFATIDLQSGATLGEFALGAFNVDDIDAAPDGFVYHTNFSAALFRIDPILGTQTLVGFGQAGPISGLASAAPVPLPPAAALLPGAIAMLAIRRRRQAPPDPKARRIRFARFRS